MHQELKECIQGTAVLGIISCNLSCEFIGTKVAWKNCLQYNIPWNEHVTKCFLCSICCMKLACRIRFYFSQWLLQWKHCVFSWHVGWVFLFQDSPSETELSHSMPKTWSCCTWILRILKAIIIIFPQFPRKIKVFNQYIIKNTGSFFTL